MTTAEMESMKELKICLVSSFTLELAKLILEQKRATQAAHLIFIMSPHMEKIIDRRFM